jgi:hypothetical protein
MTTRRNMKSRKSMKSRKNYKRVKRGGQAEYQPREALSYDGPMNMTLDPDYQRIDRMLNYNKYNQNAQRNQLERGMNKDRLSQLTRLNAFQSLAPDQQKAFLTTFMNLTPVEQDKYIENFKYLNGGKTKKKSRKNKKIRGGEKGDCTERALHTELITNPEEYYGQLKDQYCNTFVDKNFKHKKCCNIIEQNITNLSS